MVEDVPAPSIERSDPWDRTAYEDWVTRLGAERMQGFLAKLREQFRCLLVGLEDPNDDVHRLAHDVASTAGMLGFMEVTTCCRAARQAVDDAVDDAAETRARLELTNALECAVLCLDRHLAASAPRTGSAVVRTSSSMAPAGADRERAEGPARQRA